MAECLFRETVGQRMGWEVSSAGLAAAYGIPASSEAVAALEERGLDLSHHSSRPLTPALVQAADLLVVMTTAHQSLVRQLYPEASDKTVLLRAFDPAADSLDVDDPIGSPKDMYRRVRDEVSNALPGLTEFVKGFSR
jgi:protein-tyrosine-phosphatase